MQLRKIFILFILIICLSSQLFGQNTVTWQECQQWAFEQSNASIELNDLEKLRKIKNQIIKSYIPEISIQASVNYQHPTLDFSNIQIMGANGTSPSYLAFENPIHKDQYLVGLDLTQKVWDGGMAKSQQKFEDISSDIAVQNVHIGNIPSERRDTENVFNRIIFARKCKVFASSIQTLDKSKTQSSNLQWHYSRKQCLYL